MQTRITVTGLAALLPVILPSSAPQPVESQVINMYWEHDKTSFIDTLIWSVKYELHKYEHFCDLQ